MNIRKIILEEISDFDWIEKINHLSFEYLNNKALEFDPPISDSDSMRNILDELKGLGFEVFNWKNLVDSDSDFTEPVVGLYMGDGKVVWTADIYDTYQEHIDDYADRHVEVINGRGIFGDLILESNDFEWTDDIPEASQAVTEDMVELGLRVKIAKSSQFYEEGLDGDDANPIDIAGTITMMNSTGSDDLYIEVTWDNETSNSYHHIDLITV